MKHYLFNTSIDFTLWSVKTIAIGFRVVIIAFSTNVLSDKNLNRQAPAISSELTKDSFSFKNVP